MSSLDHPGIRKVMAALAEAGLADAAESVRVLDADVPTAAQAPIHTIVDAELDAHPVVWAAAGHPKALLPTTFDELVELTGGTPAEVATP